MAGVPASNPLMADDAASVASTSSGRQSPSQEFGGFLCVTNDDDRPPSPGNASTSSAHSRASSSSASTWRRNNPYNLKRKNSEDGSRDSNRSPHSSSRQAASHSHSDHLLQAAAVYGASGASFGNASHSAVEGFIFDISHISAGDDGQALLRKSSSSWTSTSSTFDKASGRVLERSGAELHHKNDLTARNSAAQDAAATWGGGGYVVSEGAPTATRNTNAALTVESPVIISDSEVQLSSTNSFLVKEQVAHISSPTAPHPPPHRQTNGGPHSALDGPFEYFPPGLTITVFAPNNAQGQPQHIPSERIIRTAGASNVYQVLLCAQKQRDEKLAEVFRTTGKMPSTVPQVKQPHSLKPKHCAHFQFKKVCNLGSDCNFIHSMLPQSNTPTPPGGSSSRHSPEVFGSPLPPPPPPVQAPTSQPPPPPPQYTHHSIVQQSFTVAPAPVDPYAQQRPQQSVSSPYSVQGIIPAPAIPVPHGHEGGYYQQPQQQRSAPNAPMYMAPQQFQQQPHMYHQNIHVAVPSAAAPPNQPPPHHMYSMSHYQQQQLPPQGHSIPYPPPQQLAQGPPGHAPYFATQQQQQPFVQQHHQAGW